MQARRQHIERTADYLVVVLFLCAIALPAVLAISHAPREPGEEGRKEEQVADEQRRAARSPSLPSHAAELEAYPDAFDLWYSDAFGFRRELVRWHNLLFWFGLGVAGSDKVVHAQDGWLFYRANRSLECTLGALPLTPAELEAWRTMLEARRDWCAERGIQYLFVSAPSKAQIYPEYLPHDWKRVGPSRLDQLHEHLDRASDIAHLDLRPALLAEKERGDRPEEQDWLYYPLGTHWASRGKVVAYIEIVRALAQGVLAGTPIPRLEDFRRLSGEGTGDSWAGRLYLEDFLHQADWQFRSTGPLPDRSPIPTERMAVRFELPQAPELPRLVLHHDSFAVGVRSLLARHFSRASCYWTAHWQIASLIAERPDVVVDFMVERMLHVERPELLQIKDQARLAVLFAAGGEEREIDLSAEDLELNVLRGNSVSYEEGALVLQRLTNRRRRWGLFDLHELHAPPGFDLVLEFDLEAPEATTLELSYPAVGLTLKHKRGQGPQVHLEPGRQIVHVLLESHRMRLGASPVVRVGAELGESRWVVHAVRVRTTPSVREAQ